MSDPNSQHQIWSSWTFSVYECGRYIPKPEVELNIARWLAKGFGRAGRVKVFRLVTGWRVQVLIEGPPAHDPEYVKSVRRQFASFVTKGWGLGAWGDVSVRVMAGDVQDGRPRAQLIEMPHLIGS